MGLIKKILNKTYVIQEKTVNKHNLKRLNLYNPLTYIVILLCFVIGFILFGIIGIWKEIDLSDLKFKYK